MVRLRNFRLGISWRKMSTEKRGLFSCTSRCGCTSSIIRAHTRQGKELGSNQPQPDPMAEKATQVLPETST